MTVEGEDLPLPISSMTRPSSVSLSVAASNDSAALFTEPTPPSSSKSYEKTALSVVSFQLKTTCSQESVNLELVFMSTK